MEKRINLGRGTATGFENQKATVEVKLSEDDQGRTRLSMSGTITTIRGVFVTGGQIEDELLKMYNGNPKITRMVDIWKKYHLNGMHPECEHQRELGWCEMANETIDYSRYCLKSEILLKQNGLNEYIDEILKTSGKITLSEDERILKGLPYFTYNLDGENAEYYKLDKKEERRRRELAYKEDQRGLILKPCPVCGHKYGSEWLYMPIPEDVIAEIKSWERGGNADER